LKMIRPMVSGITTARPMLHALRRSVSATICVCCRKLKVNL
jgi:hypothetical protein